MTSTSASPPNLPVGSQGQPITVIGNKYRLSRRLGGGSFGDIYLGEYIPTGEKVAIKFEKHGARCPQLRHEYKVYRELQHCVGFGKVHYFGQHDCFNVMVMELLGYSLEDLFNKCGRRFSLRTVLQLADQVLERVETMHNRHLIHRDIKPANFVIGHGANAHVVHCIDFGLSKRYRHPRTLQHIAYRDGRSLTGTPRYASINNHLGIEQSRRDDLESIGYVLVYFLRGVLPWQGLKAKTASKKYKMIMEKKQSVSITELCQGCPIQFAEYLTYCRSLSFDGKPDMQYLRGLFRDLYLQQGYGPSPASASASASAATGGAARLIEWDWDRFLAPAAASARSGGGGGGGGGEEEKARERERRERERSERHAAMEVVDLTGSDPPTPQPHPPAPPAHPLPATSRGGAAPGSGSIPHRAPEPPVAMMMTAMPQGGSSDLEAGGTAGAGGHGPTSPLNKLKSSLRISDDDGGGGGGGGGGNSAGGGKSHKRHLSLSHGAEGAGGAGDGAAGWQGGADYKQQLGGSRPKTAHPSTASASASPSGPAAGAYKTATTAAAAAAAGPGASSPAYHQQQHQHPPQQQHQQHQQPQPLQGAGVPATSPNGSGGGKQDTSFLGFLRKAKSFARPTSTSNLGSAPGVASGGSGSGSGGAGGAASARRAAMASSSAAASGSSSAKVSAGGCGGGGGGVDVICA